MESLERARALNGHLRAQLPLLQGCRARAAAASRLRLAWIDHFIRLGNAMAATGGAIAQLRHTGAPIPVLRLRLPLLPSPSDDGEGTPLPLPQNNPRPNCQSSQRFILPAWNGSSPAQRGRGTAKGG